MKIFSGKTAIVTGAASGMGRALTEHLLAAGARVIATDINEQGLNALSSAATTDNKEMLETAVLNVCDREAFSSLIKHVAERHGLDYLFNNAGIAITSELKDNSKADWQRTIDINQMGVLYGTLAAYEVMRQQGHGHIVNTASIAGLMAAPMMALYAMTKHAVVGLSLSLREEARIYGVKVSVVCPGIVETNIVGADQMQRLKLEDDSPFDFIRKKTPVRPITASKAAQYILRGVQNNQPEIVFPLHGRLAVAAFHNARRLWEASVRPGLKMMRGG